MFLFELQISIAVFLDLLFGDPRWLPHPVRLIGFFCNTSEKIFRKVTSSEAIAGLLSFVTVLLLTLGGTTLLIAFINLFSPLFAKLAAVYLLYTMIAARDLVVHSRQVYSALQEDTKNLDAARIAVAQIVGRDTAALDRKEIIRASIETVAENMVDGVTAPLFYAVLFSIFAPLTGIDPLFLAVTGAMGYKAVNTMDSMFGYKNDQYLHFGRIAAKFDDFVNLLPARISGLLLVPAACILGLNWRNALFILKRDRLAHASPNAAHPEAAVAGALDVELGGVSIYFGREVKKPTIGDNTRPINNLDILLANRLMLIGSFFFLFILLICRFSLIQLFT